MNFQKLTIDEFKVKFPRARGAEKARYYIVLVEHKTYPIITSDMIPDNMIDENCEAVQVGHTKISHSKKTTRWAVVPIDNAET